MWVDFRSIRRWLPEGGAEGAEIVLLILMRGVKSWLYFVERRIWDGGAAGTQGPINIGCTGRADGLDGYERPTQSAPWR